MATKYSWVALTGGLQVGFAVTGPFDSHESALEYANEHLTGPATVMAVRKPNRREGD